MSDDREEEEIDETKIRIVMSPSLIALKAMEVTQTLANRQLIKETDMLRFSYVIQCVFEGADVEEDIFERTEEEKEADRDVQGKCCLCPEQAIAEYFNSTDDDDTTKVCLHHAQVAVNNGLIVYVL